jgi:acyl carrier protein
MRNKIKTIISEVLKINVDDSTSQATCGEWDSLRHLNLVFELETAFHVSFEPDEMARMINIDVIEEIIKAK